MYLFSEIDTSSARLSLASSLTFFFFAFFSCSQLYFFLSCILLFLDCSPRCFEESGYVPRKGNNETTYILGKNWRVGCVCKHTLLQTNISAAAPHMWGPRPRVKALSLSLSFQHAFILCSFILHGFDCFFFHKPALAEYIKNTKNKGEKRGSSAD